MQRKRKVINSVLYINVLIVLAILFSQCTFSRHARKSYERAENEKPYDVVIVPGLPFDYGVESSMMKMRIFWAKHLYDSGFTKNIIFSGSSVYTPYVESIAMKVIADSLGIPKDAIYTETEAEHSTENVYYSWKLAKELGFKKIALATDPFQAKLLRAFVKKQTPGVKIIPTVLNLVEVDEKELPRIDPSSAYVTNFVSIRERESFWERFRGTLGKKVKEDKKFEAKKQKEQQELVDAGVVKN